MKYFKIKHGSYLSQFSIGAVVLIHNHHVDFIFDFGFRWLEITIGKEY